MKKHTHIYTLFLVLAFCTSCNRQSKTEPPKSDTKSEKNVVIAPQGSKTITRNIIQDKKGNIWIAAYDGIFRYDGKSFINITTKMNSTRFFSVLEDKKGNFWFSSVGSGIYYYDGKSFRNFTTEDGLANNQVTEIYEDKTGNIWFSTAHGISRYDGQSFQNFTTKDGLSNNDVNRIIEDKTGKLWIGTRENACIYDGNTFTVLTHEGKPFKNVRSIIEDKNGNIWLGGNDGLWCYDGRIFINYSENFVGYIHEDKTGNIWTSSKNCTSKIVEKDLQHNTNQNPWTLSRYNENSLLNNAVLPKLVRTIEGNIFGILEANDGSIWFGTLNGVYRYDDEIITDLKSK